MRSETKRSNVAATPLAAQKSELFFVLDALDASLESVVMSRGNARSILS